MADLISIVVPTRNRSHMLRQALACARAQTWRSIEIVVVDEGSTDDTPAVLKTEFPDVKVIRHDPAQGLSAARNAGTAAATGDWVHYWDDDDLMHPRHLEDLLQASKAAPPRSIVTCRSRNFAVLSGEIVFSPVVCAPEVRSDLDTVKSIVDPRSTRTILHSGVLWPRRLFDRLSWDPVLGFNEDFDLIIRSTLDGWHFVGRPVGKYYVRLHTGPRITTTMNVGRLRSPALSWLKWAELLKADPVFAAVGPALRNGLMAQRLATALAPQCRDLAPKLDRAFRDWGGTRPYVLYPPTNPAKRALVEAILQLGGPSAVQRFFALMARFRPEPPPFVASFTPPTTDEDREDAAAIRRFID
jgi:glycosyltransferase involved in cell wall biosynthesis